MIFLLHGIKIHILLKIEKYLNKSIDIFSQGCYGTRSGLLVQNITYAHT